MGSKLEYIASIQPSYVTLISMGTINLSLTEEELKERFYQLKTRKNIASLLEISDY